LDFVEYSKLDRSLFGFCVVETGMIVVLILYVQLTKNAHWEVESFFEQQDMEHKTYLYAMGMMLLVNIMCNWGEFDFCIKCYSLEFKWRVTVCMFKLFFIGVVAVLTFVYKGEELVYLAWLILNLALTFWH
jgi:hypothetical protein